MCVPLFAPVEAALARCSFRWAEPETGVLVAIDWISVAQFAPESTEVMIAFAGEAALTLRLAKRCAPSVS